MSAAGRKEMGMQLRLDGGRIGLTPALREHIERRIRFALGRVAGAVGRVSIRLDDLNGPRGGVDKRCRVLMQIPRAGTAVVEAVDSDLYAAIDGAAERARRAALRRIERARPLAA